MKINEIRAKKKATIITVFKNIIMRIRPKNILQITVNVKQVFFLILSQNTTGQ